MKKSLNFKFMVSFLMLLITLGPKICVSQFNSDVLTKAQNGNAEAQFEIGKFYFESYWNEAHFSKVGKGNINWDEAEQWFNKAANQGHIKAKFYLYEQFQSKSTTYECNIDCLKKAALEGIEEAQYSLASTYLTDKFDTPKDLSLAYKWLFLALKDKLNQYGTDLLSLRDLIEVYKISHLEISKGQIMAKEHIGKYGPSTSMYPDSE